MIIILIFHSLPLLDISTVIPMYLHRITHTRIKRIIHTIMNIHTYIVLSCSKRCFFMSVDFWYWRVFYMLYCMNQPVHLGIFDLQSSGHLKVSVIIGGKLKITEFWTEHFIQFTRIDRLDSAFRASNYFALHSFLRQLPVF